MNRFLLSALICGFLILLYARERVTQPIRSFLGIALARLSAIWVVDELGVVGFSERLKELTQFRPMTGISINPGRLRPRLAWLVIGAATIGDNLVGWVSEALPIIFAAVIDG